METQLRKDNDHLRETLSSSPTHDKVVERGFEGKTVSVGGLTLPLIHQRFLLSMNLFLSGDLSFDVFHIHFFHFTDDFI